MITKHFEHNFFSTFFSKNFNDCILYEDYVKKNEDTNHISENYSIFSLEALFIFLNSFQIKLINQKFPYENNDNDNDNDSNFYCKKEENRNKEIKGFNKNFNFLYENFIGRFFKEKKNDVLLNLINQHMKIMIDDIMQMSVINPEAELSICQSLFYLKMILKENSFYFTRKELENIFNKLKCLRE
jgi:hypothetical protein